MFEIRNISEVDERIYAEQISLLYTGSIYRPALHIISVAIFVCIIFNHVNPFHVYIWVILVLGINTYRFIDIYKTQKAITETNDFTILQKRYAVCASLFAIMYGFGFVFFFNQLPLLNQVYLVTLIGAMIPAGLVSFASDKVTFYFYFHFLTLPVVIRLLSTTQVEHLNIGICAIFYLLIVRQVFVWNYNVLADAIRLKNENENLLRSLRSTNKRLSKLSEVDGLTQVGNRRNLDETLKKEWLRATRMSTSISILMIDVDFFKQYNDEFGHIKGDECLVYIADFLKNKLNRPGDFIARYGGEEFCIIMPDTELSGAVKFAEKIRAGVEELEIDNPGSEISQHITISIGVASVIPKKEDTYMDIIYTSDVLLYGAKKEGRNIICSKESLEKNPKPRLVV